MLAFLKNIFSQIKTFINSYNVKLPPTLSGPAVLAPTKPEPLPEPVKPVEVKPVALDEPAVSSPTAKITSFLLKPVSDTNPKIATFSVSCDDVRAEDVRIEIKDKDGNKIIKFDEIKLKEKYNVGGIKRNNQLPGHKYGRFNFKPGLTAEQFKTLAPLEVSFFLELNGQSTLLKVMGKKSIKIKDPTQRLDLK